MTAGYYAKEGEEKEHSGGPYIVEWCIAIHVNDYMKAAGLEGSTPEGEDVYERLVDYSEWLEDRFNRGFDSPEDAARSFMEEYADVEPKEVEESLGELRADLLRVVEGLDLALSRVRKQAGSQ